MKKPIKILALVMLFVMVLTLAGCGANTDMPFNGQVDFHKISLTVPEKFIRDSTQSSDDVWVFEQGFYKKLIIISRSDISGDVTSSLEGYADYMKEQGAVSDITDFAGHEAVHSAYTKDEMYCQEMLFAHDGSFYAIALRGGSEEDFWALLDTVIING